MDNGMGLMAGSGSMIASYTWVDAWLDNSNADS
jgi:hypothetical protein